MVESDNELVSAAAVDEAPPRFASGFANGATVVLRFTELGLLDAVNAPGPSSFNISVDQISRGVSGVLVDPYARTVTLTLAAPVSLGQRVAVSYRDPTTADDALTIQDGAGNDASSFRKTILNLTGVVDRIAPSFGGARVDGNTLVMSYVDANPLDAANPPAPDSFQVMVAGALRSISGVVVDASARTVTLTLASAVTAGQSVTVGYLNPTRLNDAAAIQDAAGNDAATLRPSPVFNITALIVDATPPAFTSAVVNGSTLVMSYSELNLLDAAHAPGTGAFAVTVGGVARAVSSVSVDANAKTVTLTLASAVGNDQAVTVAYADPTGGNDANAIQDAGGNDAASLTATAVTNNTPDTTSPVFAGATVNGATLVMTYTEANLLDAANPPLAGAFAVTVGGVARGVSAVSVDAGAKTVTLTLSSPVSDGQAVTVAYADPTGGNDAGAIQDASGNDAASLPATAVDNRTPLVVLDLSALDGTAGFKLNGVYTGGMTGFSVGAAGDLNGDGFGDFVIGARVTASNYVVFGKASGWTSPIELADLNGLTGFRLDGSYGAATSQGASSAGDFNGDGITDLLIGNANAGPCFVIFGKQSAFASVLALSSLDGTTGFSLGASNQFSGMSVAPAGDFDGDGFDDLLVGAANDTNNPGVGPIGSGYVVFGRATVGANLVLGPSTSLQILGLPAEAGKLGSSASAAGDINGDGFADVVLGAPDLATDGPGGGKVAVVFGLAGQQQYVLPMASLDGSNGFVLAGAHFSDEAGFSVSGGGDINGDGFDDIIVGARYARHSGSYAGAAYVVFGKASGFAAEINLGTLTGLDGFRLDGASTYDYAGTSVSNAGDFNGDGYDDMLVGAPNADGGVPNSGAAYLVYGKGAGFGSSIDLAALDGTDGFRIDGNLGSARAARGVSAAGDVNGDGFADILVGEHYDYGSANGGTGAAYVIFGGNSTHSVTFLGTNAADSLAGGTTAAESFVAGEGADTMTGGGGADVFHGGAGNDTIVALDLLFRLADGGSGVDRLVLAGGGHTLDLPDTTSRFQGIEVIDLTGSGDNELVLTATAATNLLAAGSTLTVDGNAGDSVRTADTGWTDAGVVGSYHVYTHGQATLKINTAISDVVVRQEQVVSVSSLNGANGFRLGGTVISYSGTSVSSAGDINGDGFDDLIVGAPYARQGSGVYDGAAFVVFGKTSGFAAQIDLGALDGTDGFRIDGAITDSDTGQSVSGAGDLNGDGFSDLLIGSKAGSAYLVFGKGSAFAATLDLATVNGTDGVHVTGLPGAQGGRSVSAAGDVNGDGWADVVIGAPNAGTGAGSAFVLFGGSTSLGATVDVSAIDGSNGFRINGAASDKAGWSVSDAGDVNGDGIADLVIGATGVNAQAGAAYVVFGRTTGFAADLSLASLDGTAGFAIPGLTANDVAGVSVSAAGDVNGDGFGDLIVGAYGATPHGALSGSSYVVFGSGSVFSSSFNLSQLDGTNGFRMDGGVASGQSGYSVSAAGDFNGDGFADLIVGARNVQDDVFQAGEAYVVFGKASGFNAEFSLRNLDDTQGLRIRPTGQYDRLGSSVSAAGDINGDGFDDVIVGAPYGLGTDGASYVIFGSGSATFSGTGGDDALNAGTSAAESFVAGLGNDTMVGGGGADVFHGGEGDDTIIVSNLAFRLADGGNGMDTLALSGSGINMTLANERGTISGIEVIDLTGSGNNTLNLTALDLLNLSDSGNTLMVKGNAGDAVNAALGAGFTTGSDQVVNGVTYHTYTQGAAVLLVGVNITSSDIHIS